MKKTLFILWILLFFYSSHTIADPLIVAVDTDFKPFEFKGDDGNFYGFDIDLWKEIAIRNGLEYKFVPMNFHTIIPALKSKNIDVALAAMTITKERKKIIDFSHPYYDSALGILVRDKDLSIKGLEDLNGKIVGSRLGTTSVSFLEENINAKEIKLFPDAVNFFGALESKAVDAVFFDFPPLKIYSMGAGKGKVRLLKELYKGQSYGIAFPKGSELRDVVTKSILRILIDGTYDKLFEKWFSS